MQWDHGASATPNAQRAFFAEFLATTGVYDAWVDWVPSRKTSNEQGEQMELLMPDNDVHAWEYAVLVTNSTYVLDAFGQLYRDRADCENGFDELENQWSWGGLHGPGH